MRPFYHATLPLLLAAACMTATLAQAAAPRRSPNIVIIYIDDMGYADIGPFGANGYATPHLDRMAGLDDDTLVMFCSDNGPWLCCDLDADPGQKNNLAARRPDVLQWMLAYAEARQELGDGLTGRKGTGRREPGRLPKPASFPRTV